MSALVVAVALVAVAGAQDKPSQSIEKALQDLS